MRVLAMAALMLLVAADQSASAASCNKGMLWPYVRNPGDCLTDGEIAAGARGVYNGPVDTNPNVGGMGGVAAPAQQAAPVQQPIPIKPNGAPAPVAAPAVGVNTYAAPAPATYAAPAPAPTAGNCTKGPLWPFVKKPGDCGTDGTTAQDKTFRRGDGCLYRKVGDCMAPQKAAVVTTASAGVGPIAQAQAAQAQPVAQAQAIQASAPAATRPNTSAAAAPSCTKGLLWPFVKKAGDCPSAAEQKKSR